MKAMRRGAFAPAEAVAAARDAPGSIASSRGSATAVPSPWRKVRRGSCQVLFIESRADSSVDENRSETLQKQAGISRFGLAKRIRALALTTTELARGVHAAAPFPRLQAHRFVRPVRTTKRPAGSAPGI